MKSERRHELQHNELAEWLIKTGQALKPYQNIVFAAVVLVLIAFAGYNIWSRMAAARAAKAWDEVALDLGGGYLTKLAQVVEDYPNTNVAHMAAVVLADYYLADGCNQLFVDKATAQDELGKAVELYQLVRRQNGQPSLLERATFGLARAREAKGEAEQIKQAEQLYAEVVAKWPNGAYAEAAKRREEDLKLPATKELYDQFALFDPKPAFSKESGDKLPFDMESLPEEGSALMPEDADNGKGEPKPDANDSSEKDEK